MFNTRRKLNAISNTPLDPIVWCSQCVLDLLTLEAATLSHTHSFRSSTFPLEAAQRISLLDDFKAFEHETYWQTSCESYLVTVRTPSPPHFQTEIPGTDTDYCLSLLKDLLRPSPGFLSSRTVKQLAVRTNVYLFYAFHSWLTPYISQPSVHQTYLNTCHCTGRTQHERIQFLL